MQACQVEQLLGSYGTELYRYCRRLAGFGPDGEDLYQQTFLRMLELDLAPDEGRNPRALLYSVATGLWRNEARKRSRRAAIARPVELDGDDPPPLAGGDEPEAAALAAAENRALAAAVERLPDKYRAAVLLAYGAELPLEEVARIEKLPKGTVKSRLHKARLLLKKEMEARGYGREEL